MSPVLAPRPLPVHTTPRQFSRSEKMLLDTLRRAEEQDDNSGDSDNDYFDMSRDLLRYSDRHHSRSASHTGSPIRPLKRNPSTSRSSRPASPAASRLIEREKASRRRTPSPSPRHHHGSRPNPPAMHRTQTAPAPLSQHLNVPSRPATPSARRSTSPAGLTHTHSRYRSTSTSQSARTAQEDLLRARLEGVLANNPVPSTVSDAGEVSSNHAGTSYGTSTVSPYGVMTPAGRSRGPSISSAYPPILATANPPPSHTTASGDHWTWPSGAAGYSLTVPPPAGGPTISVPTSPRSGSRRAPSVSRTQAVPQGSASPTNPKARSPIYYPHEAMITPPPSPPFDDDASSSSHSPPPPTHSRSGSGVGYSSGHSGPSTRSPSVQPSPACFDARSASLMLRDQSGYVSFCDIEGLGEPSQGVDADDEGPRGRGRWWEVWRK